LKTNIAPVYGLNVGRDGAVSIATSYLMDGPGKGFPPEARFFVEFLSGSGAPSLLQNG